MSVKNKFYLVIPPGLEVSAQREIKHWYPLVEVKGQGPGGLECEVDLLTGFGFNLTLKVPARILLRLSDFGCRDFPKLFKKMKGFDWSRWLSTDDEINVEASSHSSWLKIKKRIEETVFEGIKAAGFGQGGFNKDAGKTIYVRFQDNVCFVSLDTSGEILHKRGYRVETPEAPLRENLASALLWALIGSEQPKATSNVLGKVPGKALGEVPIIVDPMAGSGTFLIEGLRLTQSSELRDFAFQKFPYFLEHQVEFKAQLPPPEEFPFFREAIGFEVSQKTEALAQKASQKAAQVVASVGGVARVKIQNKDIFYAAQANTEVFNDQRVWLVCNPPYGRRLKVNEPLPEYYSKLLSACEKVFAPERAGFLLPGQIPGLRIPKEWRREKMLKFSNGGIRVQFHMFARA